MQTSQRQTCKATATNQYGTIKVGGGSSKIASDDERTLSRKMIPSLIDELPLLAVVGSQIPGGIRIEDAAELRLKESDRLASTAVNLRAMGAEVEEFEDGLHGFRTNETARRDDRLVWRSSNRNGFRSRRSHRRW